MQHDSLEEPGTSDTCKQRLRTSSIPLQLKLHLHLILAKIKTLDCTKCVYNIIWTNLTKFNTLFQGIHRNYT